MFRSIPLVSYGALVGVGLFGLAVGCWTGADSRGLPCEDNSHCGAGLDCVNGYCGGEPLDGLCGNGWVDPGEDCDPGAEDGGGCRPDCTAHACGDGVVGPDEECDLGSQNANTGECTLECKAQACGDGFVGPGEQCDPLDDPNCRDDCVPTTCGDGIVDPGEDCDDRGESPDCDADCSLAECGDGQVNGLAGEDCDDGDEQDGPACMGNCTHPILWADMDDGSADGWTHTKLSGGDEVLDTWTISDRDAFGGAGLAWDSGIPAPGPGDIRLMTPPIDLGPFGGQAIELRFDHSTVLADCNNSQISHDGGIVEVSVDGGPYQTITPTTDYHGEIGVSNCLLGTEGPLDGQLGYVLDHPYDDAIFDLSEFAGQTITIGFRLGSNCQNCLEMEEPQGDRGWFIDNVAVYRLY